MVLVLKFFKKKLKKMLSVTKNSVSLHRQNRECFGWFLEIMVP